MVSAPAENYLIVLKTPRELIQVTRLGGVIPSCEPCWVQL